MDNLPMVVQFPQPETGLEDHLHTLCQRGQLDGALRLLCHIDVPPSETVCLSLLKACNKTKELNHAKLIHAHMVRLCPHVTGFLGDSLVVTMAKCGAPDDAFRILQSLPCRTVFSWTVLISAYTDCFRGEEALRLYWSMLEDGVQPDKYTFVSLFKACGSIPDLVAGRNLHEDARKRGFASDVFVGSSLVMMYSKCGSIVEAESTFGDLSRHDVVSWNTMLSAYCEQGQVEKALMLFRQMLEEGVSMNRMTLTAVLQVCSAFAERDEAVLVDKKSTKVLSLEIGMALHALAQQIGFASDAFIGSALISMYGKSGRITEAENVFGGLLERDVALWTAMLSAYAEQGQAQKSLQLYRKMQEEGLSPNEQTSLTAVQACGIIAEKEGFFGNTGLTKSASLEIVQALHIDAQRKGFDSHVFLSSTFVSIYGKCGTIVEAENTFNALFQRNVVSWNAMLSAYVEQGQAVKALKLYRQMQEEKVTANQLTFTIALQACAVLAEETSAIADGLSTKLTFLEIAKALHADAHKKGLCFEDQLCCTLISTYGKCGAVSEAENVFCGLPQRNIVTWNAMLSVYVEQGQSVKALKLYPHLQNEVLTLTDVTVVCLLQACSDTGRLEICWQLHFGIVSAGCEDSPLLANTLVHSYGSCASMRDAQAVFDVLPQPEVVAWSACIAGYACEGNFDASLQMFEQMITSGINPDAVTFLSILSACSHAGLVDRGLEYFESMSKDYSLSPDTRHFTIMIDLFGRAGNFKRIKHILSSTPVQADLAFWLSLLGVCHAHGNVELGILAFEHVMRLQPEEATAYVLMSNIYADAGVKSVQVLQEFETAISK